MFSHIKKEMDALAIEILESNEEFPVAKWIEKIQLIHKKLILLEHHLSDTKNDVSQTTSEVTSVMETINELVTELPLEEEEAAIKDLFASVSEPEFVKKEEGEIPPKKGPKSLNEVLAKRLQIGINDRLAFIKNLFNESAEEYQRVLSQIQTCSSWEEAKDLIEQMIKPDYNNWEGKETFELRFLKCIESSF